MHKAPSLPELQQQFTAAVLGDASSPLNKWVQGRGLAAEARLQIYHNIVLNNHAAALRTAYPAVHKLVGEDFFEAVAARYFCERPTQSGNLQDYGVDFPEYLAQLPEAAGLAYLPDVARLEWARQESTLAADAEAIAITVLVAVNAAEPLRLRLHPSLRLISSGHALLDIWRFCQETEPGDLELFCKQQSILIWRVGAQIAMQEMDAGGYAFMAALLNNKTLAAAHQEALRAARDFDMSASLHWLFTTGLVTGLTTA